MTTMRKRNQPLIMIADADEYERHLLRAILKSIGFEVIEAWDLPQLVKLAKEQSPDLLIVDLTLLRLGRTDGLERIRRQSALPNLPIVAVAVEDTNPQLQRSESSTVFLQKPIEYAQFYTLVDRFLPGQMTSRARSKYLPI